MKKLIYISTIIIAASFSGCTKKGSTTASSDNHSPAPDMVNPQVATAANDPATTNKEEIKWISYDEAVKLSKKKPKKIFVDVYTDWCGWCKKMDKTTFKDPKVAEYMNKYYYAVKLDAESEKKIVFQGKELTESVLATKVFGITGYPSTVYLDFDEKIIQPVPGYMDVVTLKKILNYIGEDHYKTQSWEQFQMSYKE